MQLSVIDQSPIPSGGTAQQALQETLALAKICDQLGYHRYWLAEHHGSASFAGCAPEIMIAEVANATQHIRVGSGGVMLMHYSPYKVAESFKLLQCLHPNRIDLGIGRAPGSDGITALALAYGSKLGIEHFPAKLADLAAFLENGTPATQALSPVKAEPTVSVSPQLWMLGSTLDGASIAAYFGLPYAHAHFIGPDDAIAGCKLYRQEFRAANSADKPKVSLSVFVLCNESQERVQSMARCRDVWRARVEKGEFLPFPTESEAQGYRFSNAELTRIAERSGNQIIGQPDQVKEQLEALISASHADELSIISITPEFADRIRCYELLADMFNLQPAQ